MLQYIVAGYYTIDCINLFHADFVFSTAHRSKGLEFDTVKVSDDFTPEFKVTVYGPFGDELQCKNAIINM